MRAIFSLHYRNRVIQDLSVNVFIKIKKLFLNVVHEIFYILF